MTIGERLKLLRTRNVMSQADLAKAAGVSPNTIWRIETGRTVPQAGTLRKMAHVFGVEPRRLMSDDDSG